MREERDVSLPLRRRAADDGDATVAVDAHDRAFERNGRGRLDVVHQTDPEIASGVTQACLFAASGRKIECLERELHAARIVPAVVLDRTAPGGAESRRIGM